MIWNPQLVEARLTLGLVPPECYPPLAWAALEAGLDGPVIRRVAALDLPSGYETDHLREHFMWEAGLRCLSEGEAWVVLGRQRAREILAHGEDLGTSLRELEQIWSKSEYEDRLTIIGRLEDDVYVAGGIEASGQREYVVTMIREAAAPFMDD